MREFIERFSYRFQLWKRERYGDYSPADSTAPRNPLRFVSIVAVMSVILAVAEPFVFHRAFDVVAIVNICFAVVFFSLLDTDVISRAFTLWQQNSLASWFQVAFFAAVLLWLLHIRDRYFRYTENAEKRT